VVGEETVRYTYRLRPGRQAETRLLAEWDCVRWVYNQTLERKKNGERCPSRCLTEWRAEHEWLRAGSQNAQQSVLWNFPTRAKHFKSVKRTLPSIAYTTRGFSIRDDRLVVAKVPPIPVVWHRELPSEPTSVRVHRDAAGRWWASFVVRRDVEPLPAADGRGIGIDWGVSAVATTTDPDYDLPHPEHGKRAAEALARSQRQMARRRPPRGHRASSGYLDAKRRTAKLYAQVQRRRRHDALQWANRVVVDHDLIAVEDFRPKFLARSTMARKAADGAVGATKRTLIERAERAGREVVIVPPAYTTMTCSACSARAKHKLALSERTFRCCSCGHTEDRDRNAARVILATAETNRAGVETVRHSDPPSEVGRVLVEPESPRL
jgi:putative transposase